MFVPAAHLGRFNLARRLRDSWCRAKRRIMIEEIAKTHILDYSRF